MFILSLQFFFWTTDDLLNLALLLPICSNYEHVKIGTCETLKIHQSFSCINVFQEIKLRKMLLTWVEKLLLSLVYKKMNKSCLLNWKKQQGFKNNLQTLVFYKIFPRIWNWGNSRSQCGYKGCGGESTKLCIWRNSKYWYESYPNFTYVQYVEVLWVDDANYNN